MKRRREDHMGPPPATSLANWMEPPYNRWSFWRVPEIVPSVSITRGDGSVAEIPRAERDLTGIEFTYDGATRTIGRMLEDTFTDAFVVVHRGEIITEWYADPGGPEERHLLMSVSKSLTAATAGALVQDGRLDARALVTDIVPTLAGSSFEGATVQHLLDMTTGTRFDESDYEDRGGDAWAFDAAIGWRPRANGDPAEGTASFIAALHNDREHGESFEYRSPLTDLLGWVIAEATGRSFAEVVSRELWSRLGCEQDATITVDAEGFPLADGGICTTARDLARFGLLFLHGGTNLAGERVLGESWVARLRRTDPNLVAKFAASIEATDRWPAPFYHDCWWVKDAERGIYAGEGIHGQLVLVHHPSDTVVVKFSTWSHPWVPELAYFTEDGVLALCDKLAAAGTD